MKIAFFGTPEFAKDTLAGILEHRDVEVVLVVTQPDKPVGRKKQLLPPPVKQLALEKGIPVLQPQTLRKNIFFVGELQNYDVDFVVVVAYGKIIPQSILDIPKHGAINIHGSLLPEYRGASPVQSAVRDGKRETGLTIMYMNKRMDEGNTLDIEKVPIDKDDTSEDIFQKFVQVGPLLLVKTLKNIITGKAESHPQKHEKATYCSMIKKEDGEVSFLEESAKSIYNKYRAFQPWPGIYTYIDQKRLVLEKVSLGGKQDLMAGTFVKISRSEYGIVCKDKKILLLHQVKPEGKKSMDILSFVNGNKNLFVSVQ